MTNETAYCVGAAGQSLTLVQVSFGGSYRHLRPGVARGIVPIKGIPVVGAQSGTDVEHVVDHETHGGGNRPSRQRSLFGPAIRRRGGEAVACAELSLGGPSWPTTWVSASGVVCHPERSEGAEARPRPPSQPGAHAERQVRFFFHVVAVPDGEFGLFSFCRRMHRSLDRDRSGETDYECNEHPRQTIGREVGFQDDAKRSEWSRCPRAATCHLSRRHPQAYAAGDLPR